MGVDILAVDRLLCLCFCLIESVKRFPSLKKAVLTEQPSQMMLSLCWTVLLVCVCSIKGGKGGWCLQQGWQPVRLLTIAQNHVHHSFTSAPCPDQNSNNILCFSYISPKLFALYFSSGWFQARIVLFDCFDDNANRHLHLYLRLLFPFWEKHCWEVSWRKGGLVIDFPVLRVGYSEMIQK